MRLRKENDHVRQRGASENRKTDGRTNACHTTTHARGVSVVEDPRHQDTEYSSRCYVDSLKGGVLLPTNVWHGHYSMSQTTIPCTVCLVVRIGDDGIGRWGGRRNEAADTG